MDAYEASVDEASRKSAKSPNKNAAEKICTKADALSKTIATVELIGGGPASTWARNAYVEAWANCGNVSLTGGANGSAEVSREYKHAREEFLRDARGDLGP
jgi:hypothetical protein